MAPRLTVGERKGRCLAVRVDVARALADAATLAEAIPLILQTVSANLGWQMAESWTVDESTAGLHRVATWTDSAPADATVARNGVACDAYLPGQVWQSGQPLWIADLSPALDWLSAAGFPVGMDGRLAAVLVFYCNEVRPAEDDVLEVFAAIADQLGRFGERVRGVEGLLERDEIYRLLADTSKDLVYLVDLEDRLVYTSPAVERLLNHVPAHPFDVVHPDDLEVARGSRKSVVANGYNLVTVRVRDRTGAWRWMEALGTLVQYRGQSHVIVVCRDVTDRQHAEEALCQSQRQYEALVASVDGIVWEADAGMYQFLFVSQQAERLLGYPTEQWLREPLFWVNHLHPDDRTRVVETCSSAIRERRNHNFEYRMLADDGRVVWLRNVVTVVVEAAETIKLRGIMIDMTERKRADEALYASQNFLQAVIDNSPVVVYVKDLEGRLMYVSPRGDNLIPGLSTTFIGKAPHDLFSKEIADSIREVDQRVLTTGLATHTERVVPLPGGPRIFMTIKSLLRDESGNPNAMCAIATDVTEQKQAEQALRESERKLGEAQRVAHVGHWDLDVETLILNWSDETYRIFGLVPQEKVATLACLQELIHPEDRSRIFQAGMQTARGGPRYDVEYRVVRPDGEVRIVHSQGDVTRNGSNQPNRLFGTVQDVTDRKRVEDALRRSEEMLRRAQVIAGVGNWTYDVLAGVIVGSEENYRICGWGPGPHSVAELNALCHPDDVDRMATAWKALLEGNPYEVEHRIVVNGEVRWVNVRAEPETDVDGKLVRVTGVTQETTARQRLEDQLRQAQKMEAVGRLAGGIAHDFNNILTVMNGYCAMAIDRLHAGDPLRGLLSEVGKAGERAAALTRQLLAFSRKQILQPCVTDLNALVREMTKMLQRLIGDDYELAVTLDRHLSQVMVDPGQFEQVLMNLTVNGRDAMPQGGSIAVETSNVELTSLACHDRADVEPGRYVRLTVRDTGHGMDEATQSRIFEPFFTSKEVGQGTGLGLAVVEGIVRQSGGHIEVQSEVGRGSAFSIYIPAIEEVVVPAAALAVVSAAPRGTETVLMVDDDDDVRTLIGMILRASGYKVLVARDGEEAVRTGRGFMGPIHLLVTDVVMPKMSGRRLADLLLAERPDLKILFASGYSAEIVGRHGILEGCGEYLSKPFSPVTLVRKVREMLDAERTSCSTGTKPVHPFEHSRSTDTPTQAPMLLADSERAPVE
jgi:PAS domain S-box-containing protein